METCAHLNFVIACSSVRICRTQINNSGFFPTRKGGKGEREWKNYRGISLLSMVGKIYVGILVDRAHRVTGGLIDDEQGAFRAGMGCADQIFTLKQISEKA